MTQSSVAATQIDNGNSIGVVLGQSRTDKIAFYGATPSTKPTLPGGPLGSASSGTLGSTIAFRLNALGLIQCTSFLP